MSILPGGCISNNFRRQILITQPATDIRYRTCLYLHQRLSIVSNKRIKSFL
jgi:hypothetical protein